MSDSTDASITPWTAPINSTIRAELEGSACSAMGIVANSHAPILALCRLLLDAGFDPAQSLHVYRGDVLCLRVRSIGEGARLQVRDNRFGVPVFRLKTDALGVAAAPPMRFSGSGVADTAARASAYQEGRHR